MKAKYSIISLIISISTIIATIVINYSIAETYLDADGKTQALFGLLEYLSYGYKYYLVIPGIISLIIAIIGFKRKEQKLTIFAITLSVISLVLIFIRIWNLMI